jgi:hypothetical protein
MIYLQTYIPAQPPPHPPPVASLSLLCFLEVANRRPWKAGENCAVIPFKLKDSWPDSVDRECRTGGV